MKETSKAILSTLAYFDIFDYPMTEFEIWKFLFFEQKTSEKIEYMDVRNLLLRNDLKDKVDFKDGYYFLRGRDDIINTRRRRYALAERKYMKAMRVIKVLRFFPFIKMIAVCNTLAFNNSRREADIDLFIITRRKRVWQSRFWVTGFLKIFKMRPRQDKSQDTICSTFFVDEDHLNLEKLLINENDIYLKYWIRQVVPIYNEGIYDRFWQENSWIDNNLPNILSIDTSPRRKVKKLSWCKRIINIIALLLPEKLFKNYQLKIMPAKLKELANQDTRVIVSDCMLKFHDNDRRAIFLDKWISNKKNFTKY
ncbi:MAG: hypothetical protein Q8P20_00765 [bacterium]|nr:hypothetical protein [bacterium]